MGRIREYERIIGKEAAQQIYEAADKLKDKHILCINSTSHGGGVAEMLNSMVFIFNKLGIKFGWRTLHGSSDFFSVTKRIHNSLQGARKGITKRERGIYYDTNERFSVYTHIDHDMVIIHDPQPLPLIKFYEKKQPWIARFHMDLSAPNSPVWRYVKKFVECYDHFIVSKDNYKKRLRLPQSVLYPAIDPLTSKNTKLSERIVRRNLSDNGLETDKPIITQVSRFDRWKDPIGVIKIFEKVRAQEDCQLVLLGSFSVDDPEGQSIYEEVKWQKAKSKYKRDIHILLDKTSETVNSLQRASDVVIQKSIREGFGLVVSEALYKGTPVVASNVGGIPFQVMEGINGFLKDPVDYDGFASSVLKLLRDDTLREVMGTRGREHIKNTFLITRLSMDWLNIMHQYSK